MRSRWWQTVGAVGIAVGIAFAVLAVIQELALLAQAAIVLALAALTLRGRLLGVIGIGAFCLLEVIFIPVYDRDTTTEWIAQTCIWILSVTGLVAIVGLLRERRRPRHAG
jgi:drug/metabolite transporter (DMT)-like permease